jgi:16S rRNA processing protein RimM
MKTPGLEFITIGRILAPWGVKGKVKVKVETDFPQRFVSGAEVYLDQKPQVIESAEWHNDKLVIKLRSIDSIEDAEKLRGKLIEIPFSQLQPLPEGQYYYFQLIGLKVWTTGGELLGEISEILTTGSNDVYVVSNAQGEILIPAIEDVVKSVDLEQENMVIEPIDGLLNLNQRAGL